MKNLPVGSFVAASGPFPFFLRLPIRVGIGASYFRFFSFNDIKHQILIEKHIHKAWNILIN